MYSNWLPYISGFLVLVFIAFVGKRAGWFKIISGTNALLRENISALETKNGLLEKQIADERTRYEKDAKDWHDKYAESAHQIGELQGQINILKSIPLVNIDTTLKQIAEFNKSLLTINTEILSLTKAKAQIDAEDRDVLTNQNKHIAEEVDKRINEKSV